MSFLSQITEHVFKQGKDEWQESVIIIPNQRAKLFLQKEFISKIKNSSFLPQIYTIDDFIYSLSELKKIDQNRLLFLLYQVYLKSEVAPKDQFINYLSWASLFLKDINEIDMQLVSAEEVFVNLAEIKRLETSFANFTLSANQQRYIAFYQSLRPLYLQFQKKLFEKKIGYDGLIYKEVAENISQYAMKNNFKKYFFIGFNAFSQSEITIVRHYIEHYQADILFDLDSFYYSPNSDSHIAQQINHIVKELKLSKIDTIRSDYKDIPKEISIKGVSQQVNQVMLVADKLNKMSQEELHSTAVVFADESLLIPFIHAYDCKNANITMGYPIQGLPIFHLLESIIHLALNSQRFLTKSEEIDTPTEASDMLFYHKDIMAFYQNPLIKSNFWEEDSDHYQFIQKELVEKNRIFFKFEDIPRIDTLKIPNFKKNGKAFLFEISTFFTQIKEKVEEQEQSFIDLILNELVVIEKMLTEFEQVVTPDIKLINYLIESNLQGKTIPMLGNPHEGLQVMGMLETRALDFKHIIILSANEGIIPIGKVQNSLLLYDVRRHFKLPTYKEKDAIYAYHFFRLLQRAEKIDLFYDNDSKNAVAEKSRFVRQLEFEVKNQQLEKEIKIKEEEIYILPQQSQAATPIEVAKDDFILQKLKEITYSPSKLIQYINCPLQFYLEQVLKIKPIEEVSENIEFSLLGTVTHAVLENLINEIKKTPTTALAIIETYTKDLEKKLYDVFDKENIEKNELERGKHYLAFEVIKKYLQAYFEQLKKELKEISLTFVGTEVSLQHSLTVDNVHFTIRGYADRIEIRDGKLLILDYKTGKVEQKSLSMEADFLEIFKNVSYKQAFQLLCYAYLYQNGKKTEINITPASGISCGIISLQALSRKDSNYIYHLNIKGRGENSTTIDQEILEKFEDGLKLLLGEIISQEIPFKQTETTENCTYCNFQLLCGRNQME